MKQRITIEQLNELSNEQKKQLRDWWEPQIGDVYAELGHDGRSFVRHECIAMSPTAWHSDDALPLLSIGQMIEILSKFGQDNQLENFYICNEHLSMKNGGKWKWFVRRGYVEQESSDLCDALWEYVNKVL